MTITAITNNKTVSRKKDFYFHGPLYVVKGRFSSFQRMTQQQLFSYEVKNHPVLGGIFLSPTIPSHHNVQFQKQIPPKDFWRCKESASEDEVCSRQYDVLSGHEEAWRINRFFYYETAVYRSYMWIWILKYIGSPKTQIIDLIGGAPKWEHIKKNEMIQKPIINRHSSITLFSKYNFGYSSDAYNTFIKYLETNIEWL